VAATLQPVEMKCLPSDPLSPPLPEGYIPAQYRSATFAFQAVSRHDLVWESTRACTRPAARQMFGKLALPENITLLPLPPRPPALDPVENVRQFLRDNHLRIGSSEAGGHRRSLLKCLEQPHGTPLVYPLHRVPPADIWMLINAYWYETLLRVRCRTRKTVSRLDGRVMDPERDHLAACRARSAGPSAASMRARG
jgi:hypothetical protein